MKQQTQTRKYFGREAEKWNEKSKQNQYNKIADRNECVLDTYRQHGNVVNFLDVGCGTGQLTIELASHGINAVGIDFAPEMIDVCQKNSKDASSSAVFTCASVFDYSIPDNSLDLVSAQGFIEYISQTELTKFIEILGRVLKKNGCAVVGSRNRLFNIASMNEYTQLEIKMGTAPQLLTEAVATQLSPSQQSLFETLNRFDFDLGQPISHPNTGIEVSTRYQYTPSELVRKFRKVCLSPSQIYPINFHSIPMSLLDKNEFALIKDQLSSVVASDYPTTHQFVPFSSSFVIVFTKY